MKAALMIVFGLLAIAATAKSIQDGQNHQWLGAAISLTIAVLAGGTIWSIL